MISDTQASLDSKHYSLKIHFFYVVTILAGLIILLATQHWTTLTGFTEYLSVAATITSLVLGVLAIIYSFVSSNSTNNSLGSIESSASDIRTIGGELRAIVSGGQDLQGKAERRNEELHSLIGDLRIAVETVSSKTKEIAGAVETLPTQFGELRDEVRKRTQAEPNQQSREDLRSIWTTEKTSAFLSNSSLLGIVAIKAMVDATVQEKYCNLRTLFDTAQSKNFEYSYGFLICAGTAGIFKYDYPDGETMLNGVARIKGLSDELKSLVDSEWLKRSNHEDSGKKRSANRYASRILESIVDAPTTDA
jgi:hypothetical protein